MSTREKRRRVAGLLLVALILAFCSTREFRALVTFPDYIRLPQGQSRQLVLPFPLGATIQTDPGRALTVRALQTEDDGAVASFSTPFSIAALKTGLYTVDVRLFGLIPFRRMTVDVVPPIKLIPGGHSIGVLLRSRGVMVVGHATIRDPSGTAHHPGRDGGIEVGDAILEIGGSEVTSEEQAAHLFEQAGRAGGAVQLQIKRRGRILQKQVTPVKERESGRFRVGLYIRDGAAGVGTLTFYDPASGRYGALGHVIADGETALPIDVRDGHIVDALVTSIQKGKKGDPGEKIGSMQYDGAQLGNIDRNTRFGIFGKMNLPVKNPFFPEPLPVAMADQVREGPAEIVTVVEGKKLERFQVEILRVMRQSTAEGKNMIVKITDSRLLAKTGGIVQGMSGSPILQDGRIVGAVTHVFVNDPTRGYGALIEWMLQEAGILTVPGGTSLREQMPPGAFLYVEMGLIDSRCPAFYNKFSRRLTEILRSSKQSSQCRGELARLMANFIQVCISVRLSPEP